MKPLDPQTRTALVAAFSLAVGLAAGIYGLWPRETETRRTLAEPSGTCDGIVLGPGEPQPAAKGSPYRKRYDFTEDYFTTEDRLNVWRKHLAPLRGKPVRYLEVGTFEGRSMVWMLENVLVHADSHAVGLDLLILPRYLANLARTGDCDKVRNVRGPSQRTLRNLPREYFDVIYIDGSHLATDVLTDAILAFDLLKEGGLLVFDDYAWFQNWADDMRPQVSIDAFITVNRQRLKMVHRGYQMIVQKRAHPCPDNPYRLTPVGKYCYHWVTGELTRQSDATPVPISPQEKALIERIARSPRFGEVEPVIDRALRADPAFAALNRRLGVAP